MCQPTGGVKGDGGALMADSAGFRMSIWQAGARPTSISASPDKTHLPQTLLRLCFMKHGHERVISRHVLCFHTLSLLRVPKPSKFEKRSY
jgi:hypothetical protein